MEELREEEAELLVRRVLWCCCVQVEKEEVQQREACLVLTDHLLGLLSHDSLSANQERGD